MRFGTDGVVRLSAQRRLGFGCFVVKVFAPGNVGVGEELFEVETLMMRCGLEPAEIAKKQREIDVESELGFGSWCEAGAFYKERDSNRLFVGQDFGSEFVRAGLPAIVAHEDDPSIVSD